jgi:hypothetical protein
MESIESKRPFQKTVKAFENDIALINEQAKRLGCSAAEVIHEMCQTLRKQQYLQELAESIDLLNEDVEQYSAFQTEQKSWDCTLCDGLTDAS